jgi:hypothetical protein
VRKPQKVERKWRRKEPEVAKKEEEERQARSREKYEEKLLKKHE